MCSISLWLYPVAAITSADFTSGMRQFGAVVGVDAGTAATSTQPYLSGVDAGGDDLSARVHAEAEKAAVLTPLLTQSGATIVTIHVAERLCETTVRYRDL